jgi:hypothetical protein
MRDTIRLHQPTPGATAPRRLNVFPGRHLGERELDLLQAYADDRLAPLLAQAAPGILGGLELAVSGTGPATRLRVRPGAAVGPDGRALALYYPLDLDWSALMELHARDAGAPPRDGLWLVTLRRAGEIADAGDEREPCVRDEPDPLRDTRIETTVRPGLQLVTANRRWLDMAPRRAANRVCVRHLDTPPFDPISGAVPVALVRIEDQAPLWFDLPAGRIEAHTDGPHRTLLAQVRSAMEVFNRVAPGDTAPPSEAAPPSLAELLGIDYLPAAGPLPRALLEDLGGEAPSLAFDPRDLQVDLMPVPARTVGAVVARELPRGTVSLAHGRQDRIRILVAVDDPQYRPDLMNLPRIDAELEADLYWRGKTAFEAHAAWVDQWRVLYQGLDADGLTRAQAPALPDPPTLADAVLEGLVQARRAALPEGAPLPQPYAGHAAGPNPPPTGYQPPNLTEGEGDGLYAQREALKDAIAALEDELEESFDLLQALNDYIGLQRQQLDAIGVSFTALAGGTVGDGSGLDLLRRAGTVRFIPDGTPPTE